MGRPLRAAEGGYVYHVLNRANARLTLFEKDGDYAAFEKVLAQAVARAPACEPDAANPHVRFDEREVETEHGEDRRAPADERAGNRYASPTLPRHLSTLPISP
jgi:hypothetical protein